MTERPTFEQYLLEASAKLGFKDDVRSAEQAYVFNMRAAHHSVTSGDVMAGVLAALKAMSSRYAGGRPDLLFYPAEVSDELRVLQKPFGSTLQKLFRRNILFNRNYPKAPRNGWLEPSKLYDQIEDLIRTRIVCKYMDGPRFVCDELTRHCEAAGIPSCFRELSTDAGYYAWHFYFQAPVELMENNVVSERLMWVEIQISTQLAEVITSLTHGLYEARRSDGTGLQSKDWKWDATSQHFRSAYLGHGLHLLEGIIQTFKDDMLNAPAIVPPLLDDVGPGNDVNQGE